ncbi:MAG: type II secretion system ATPase GspE [Deltaproteobacteria bacterium]|nr:type II secretion system ATPase GspE [Deltaproteobacteria bacterium]
MSVRRVEVGESLRQLGVDERTLTTARQMSEKQQIPLRESVRRVEGLDPKVLARALSQLSGLPVLETVDGAAVEPELVRTFPITIAREMGILPLYVTDGELVVGLSDLGALTALDDLRVLHGHPVRPVLVPSDLLAEAINKAYDRAAATAHAVLDVAEQEDEGEGDLLLEEAELLDDPNQAPIIRFVNALLSQAIKERASDIHIEPYEKDVVVRYRVDGVLKETIRPPVKFKNTIVARIKIMAGLNIAEKRLPQDGRIRRKLGGREIDLRVSTVPVRHGERVVMRILEKGQVFSLDRIGMAGQTLTTFRNLIRRPHGILLVSGPTGSGKSTTLYSGITEINSPDVNILTIEDPIEYEVAGIGQVQVNPKINLTFASALRSFLRQDPDIILVGEIRDRETAENAVQASLTGHLVFSSIHTNDAAGAFARLVDMGVEPFLVASSLLGVLAQRLVRRLCPVCKEAYTPSDAELDDVGVPRARLVAPVYRAKGCDQCNQLGYSGRTGIYEFLTASDEIKPLVIANKDAGTIKRKAVELGMTTLRDDGIEKVLLGVTTFDEVMRVTQEDRDGT